ncbi:LysR family transcriptional regulator [Methylobacterium fujisawaense]|uniref:LysR family transcriptional regulator n=1 Tax=Methylobacterium fujisawaense TaxID=107400 RepID=UPI0037005823
MPDIRTLDLNLLKALDALLQEQSVTRAAARLALSQPSVSGMLTRLRVAFDDPLFTRTQRGLVPTARALELQRPIKRMLSELDELLQPMAFTPGTADFTLRVAATDYAVQAVIIPFLAALRVQAPHVRVAMQPIESARVNEQLARGELDLALLTPETTPDGLHRLPLYEESYVCALGANHPAATRGTLTLNQFCALDHALVSYAGPAFEGATDQALSRHGRQRRVSVSVGSFMAIPDLLRTSDLIAVVPRRLMSGLDGIALRELPLAVPGFTKCLAWHERTHHDPRQRWVRAQLARAVQTSVPSEIGEVGLLVES